MRKRKISFKEPILKTKALARASAQTDDKLVRATVKKLKTGDRSKFYIINKNLPK